jgi:hypothetical protein
MEEARGRNVYGDDIDAYRGSVEYLADEATEHIEIANKALEINSVGCVQ